MLTFDGNTRRPAPGPVPFALAPPPIDDLVVVRTMVLGFSRL